MQGNVLFSEQWAGIKKDIAVALATASTTTEEGTHRKLEEKLAAFIKALHTLFTESGVELSPSVCPEGLQEIALLANPEQDFAPALAKVRKRYRNISNLGKELEETITQINATEFAAPKDKERWIHQLFLCYLPSWPATTRDDQLDFFVEHVLNGHDSWRGIARIALAIRGKLSLPVVESLEQRCPEPPDVDDKSSTARATRLLRKEILALIKELQRHQ